MLYTYVHKVTYGGAKMMYIRLYAHVWMRMIFHFQVFKNTWELLIRDGLYCLEHEKYQ